MKVKQIIAHNSKVEKTLSQKKSKKSSAKRFSLSKFFLSLLTLTGCGDNNMNKFDWLASESAPQNYPMQIISGDFVYKEGGGLYVPNGKKISSGWGKSISVHVVGADLKPLPTQLKITFFSYTENVFYQGSFELPYERILSLFQQSYYSTRARKQTRYHVIVAGVSPGGGVAVWLQGLDKTTQIFYGKAEIVDVDWTRINRNPKILREDYISGVLNRRSTPKILSSIKNNGVPLYLWDSYQTRYHWKPNLVTVNRPPKNIYEILYVNGEQEQLFYPLAPEIAQKTRAAPYYFYYSWNTPEGAAITHHFYLDTVEIISAFEKLEAIKKATAESPILLTVKVTEHPEGRKITLAVQHEDTAITINKIKFKTYTALHADNPDSYYQD